MVEELLSGVELFGFVLSGVVLDVGLVVLLGLVEFMSELLELELGDVEVDEELLDGVVVSVLLLDGVVVSVLLDEGEVVDDGEVEVLEPVWLDDVDGVLWLLCAPVVSLELLVLLCAMAIPVEKITAVAIVRSFLLMR